jgi:flagellar basal body-associated protein FliL
MHQENTDKYHQEFVSKLETIYGKFHSGKKKFDSTSNSKIARDLCYSDSQFSRLINNTASEGEFKRALRNVNRLLNENKLQLQQKSVESSGSFHYKKWVFIVLSLFILALFAFIAFQFFATTNKESFSEETPRYEMLKWSFENQYIKPYVKLKELPADCNYPCYKYQGKWILKNEYKIPFFRERNGFHYVAKDAVMYARCMDESRVGGKLFEGYEYQLHEIWYDKRELPIDSFLMPDNKTRTKESYNNSDLAKDDNFVKIAYVHTFFRNEFSIDSTVINRKGKVIGRDIEFLINDVLLDKVGSEKLVNELKSEINSIAKNRLEDFSKPINCQPSKVPNINFNYIEKGDELSFKCQFTTGRFLVGYEKTFVLEDQYINNVCR